MYHVKEGCLHIGLIGLEFLETPMTKRTSGAGEATVPPELHMAPGRPLNPATPDSRPFRSGDLVLGAARIRAEERGRPAGDAFATRLEAQARTMIAPGTVEVGAGGRARPL